MGQTTRDLVDLFETSRETYATRPLFGVKKDGAWIWMSYGEFGVIVDRARGGLAARGVGPGDRVAIISDNRIEWAAAAYATYGLGAAFVPMYQKQRPSEWQFILDDCGAKLVFVATEAIYAAVDAMLPALKQLRTVICLGRASGPGSWSDLLAAGAARPVPPRSPGSDEIAGLIYTSGTTGNPKGALLSHGNIASNLNGVHALYPISVDDLTLSFLPWAHSFGQTCELHMVVSYGAATAINDELPRLLDNLAEVKPTVLVAVPRIFNRIYEAVNKQIAEKPGFVQRMIRTGLRGAIKKAHGEKLRPIEKFDLAFDRKVLFGKVRERFGGRLAYVISGSATLSTEVAEFIDALGLPVYEGYGLTETSPIVTSNHPGARRMGSVGRVLPGVRVEIDTSVTGDPKEGEIIVHGPNVMKGYHNRPEETERALRPDGGLRTGDLGHFDADGYLYISGRIKEQYKLENGKYVMPSPLEELLKLSPYISNVMLHGDGRPFNVALVVINEPAIRAWEAEQGFAPAPDLLEEEAVYGLIRDEIEARAGEFKSYEKPREIILIGDDFTVDNGLLTPTLKLRRRDVVARYHELLEGVYARAHVAA